MRHGDKRGPAAQDPGRKERGRGKGRHGRRAFDNGTLRLLILQMIGEQPRHGYEIMTELEARTAGAYRPSPGVLYPNLSALEEDGLIACAADGGRRKLCSITPLGQQHLKLNAAALEARAAHDSRGGGHRFRRGAPPEIVAAMDRLKAALRHSFLDAAPAEQAIRSAATAIAAAAETIEGLDTSPVSAPAEDTDMTQIITRHRHELRRRELTVREAADLTPNMRRIVLEGPELDDFSSLGFDDHIKLFFDTGAGKPEMRDYTPRAFGGGRLTVDFAMHEAGPATDWARDAAAGDTLRIGGPRGSQVIAPVFDWYLLVGDETALPAIGRRVEELPAGVTAVTLAAVTGPEEEQAWDSPAAQQTHWVHRPAGAAADPAPLLDALWALDLPDGKGFAWIAAEAGVARALKQHMLQDRGHPGEWLKAAGYWTAGQADASDKALD
ncbi:SIP domain-containing protein [Mangrovicoccus sp. HB161399]|uniref:SIP domain-containing protein n=1 Tax=Mangrovicoccus sp. HB161399 TaxID=2720392 RepID=UPI0015518C39|nr:SIP domain-containing protein [Mangrovicoccus sp. HB161399]